MLIFDYGGKDSKSDRGQWDVSITAPNRRVADQHLVTHLASKGWPCVPESVEAFFKRSRMLGRDGLLYSNLEQKVEDADQGDG